MLSGRVECEDKSLPDVCSAECQGPAFHGLWKMIYIPSVGSHKGLTLPPINTESRAHVTIFFMVSCLRLCLFKNSS